MSILINIERYVDFDIPASAAIMSAPDHLGKSAIKAIAKEISSKYRESDDVGAVIKDLEKEGFKTCVTIDVTIGGSL